MFEKGLRNLIINDSTVGPLVGDRVRPMMLPEGSTLPAMVFTVVATTPLASMDGVNALQTKRVQIDCYAANAPAAKQLAAALHNLLDGYKGTLSEGTLVMSSLPDQDVDSFEYDPQMFRIACDFTVKFIES
jgi:Protein of unknown function (DUF3168)